MPETASPKLMTADELRHILALIPGDAEIFVHASDRDGNQVFAAVKDAQYEPTCDDSNICRLYADQEDDDAVVTTASSPPCTHRDGDTGLGCLRDRGHEPPHRCEIEWDDDD